MTRLERAKAIGNRILSLPDAAWTSIATGAIDAKATVQQGWSAVVTRFEGSPGGHSTGNENASPFAFILDVWLTGRGKVLSVDFGPQSRVISMRPGSWEQELFGIADYPQSESSSGMARAVDLSPNNASESLTQSARESRCRRRAANFGLRLHKSRRDFDRGLYALIDVATNLIAYGSDGSGAYDATLGDIETYLIRH